jgi:hypothetical protein
MLSLIPNPDNLLTTNEVNVCLWHFSDIPPVLTNVGYRG